MVAKLQTVLTRAQRGRYAVGAFNVSDLEHVQAVITAAAKMKSPVIVNTSEKAIEYAGLTEIAELVLSLAKKYPIPVVLNLDHGRDLRLAKRCVNIGYTSIMYDGSRYDFKTNVQRTKTMVQYAKRKGVGVEGELGLVKYPEGDSRKKKPAANWAKIKDDYLTDPKEAASFVKQTGIIAFAPAIGNSHGLPIPGERLDFIRLRQIRKTVSIPLVLHGASGTPAREIKQAIRLGICKINIDTDLRLAFTGAIRQKLKQEPALFDPRVMLGAGRDEVQKLVQQKIIMFGSRNTI